jgi:hypothetical protein
LKEEPRGPSISTTIMSSLHTYQTKWPLIGYNTG